MNYSVIMLCAGSGTRTGLQYNKMFYKINDETVYQKSMKVFLEDQRCQQIVVVTKREEQQDFKNLINDSRICFVVGGKERQDSVYCGLQMVNQDYVFIHDGARPYLSKECIERLIECLQTKDAGLLMVPCKDTIKVVENGIVKQTLKRETLMQAQTPQVFQTAQIKEAYYQASQDGFQATDDSQIYERYQDGQIVAVMGDYSNIKITTKEDLV